MVFVDVVDGILTGENGEIKNGFALFDINKFAFLCDIFLFATYNDNIFRLIFGV